MLQNESFLNIFQSKLVTHDLIEVFLCLEKFAKVLGLCCVLLGHHTTTHSHHLHLFNGLGIGQEESQQLVETEDENESPRHGGDIGGVQSRHHQSLLQHLLELVAKGEWHLGCDEALENVTNRCEHKHVDDTLNIGLQHIVHHVRISHHIHWVGGLYLFVQVTLLLSAVVSLAILDGILRQILRSLANPLRSLQCSSLLCVLLGSFLQYFGNFDLVFLELSLWIGVALELSLKEGAIGELGLVK